MKKFLYILILIFALYSPVAFGAELSLGIPKEVKEGNNFIANLYLDTEDVVINGVDISMSYDEEKVSFVGYKTEGGVIQLWLDAPSANAGTLKLSGIVPGGVSGSYDASKQGLQKLNLVNLIFKAKENGESNLTFIKNDIFKHDGKGTKLSANVINSKVVIKENPNRKQDEYNIEDNFDKTSPLPFEITYVDKELLSETPPLLIFSAIDEDSGILKYQIKKGNVWVDITSPHVVHKSIFKNTIILRALDHNGNIRESSVEVPGSISISVMFIVFFVLIFGFYAYKLLQYKYAKKAKS